MLKEKSLTPPSHSTPLIQLEGSVERVTFHSADSHYSVLRVKIKNQTELATVVGLISQISPGEWIECSGVWIQHLQYGKQFQAQWIRSVPPSSLDGIEKYLGSGFIRGIGPHFASQLVKAFGENVFDILDTQPERLREVTGLGDKRIESLLAAWNDQKQIRSIMLFLQNHGVSSSRAVRIFKTYGHKAIQKIQEDPYQLAQDITGIGFKSADQIAEKLGIHKDSPLRAQAGLSYQLLQSAQKGHCAYPEQELLTEASQTLTIPLANLQVALKTELSKGRLYQAILNHPDHLKPTPCIGLSGLGLIEKEVASWFQEKLKQGPPVWATFPAESALLWAEQKCSRTLAPLQRKALLQVFQHPVSILTGGPGTGKSTLTQVLCTLLHAHHLRIGLCAPTGRAAQRLSECTGFEAKTIHRILKFDPKQGGFTHHATNPLPIDLLLVDESSMIDIKLMWALLKAVPQTASVFLIGDFAQLPSVGPGQVLKDLIDSQKIPTLFLTQIFRQAANSQIIQAAHRIQAGRFPPLSSPPGENSDFYFFDIQEPNHILKTLLELVSVRIPKKFHLNPLQDIQVLTPMQRGTLGARTLNLQLQPLLNPQRLQPISSFGYQFALGDKVMVTQNDYDKEVFNGDLGFVKHIDTTTKECWIEFSHDKDPREVCFQWEELDILQPAYAITIHKSQGSEYPAIVMPVTTQHFLMLTQKLIYTGMTRGKKLVVMVGQKKALAIALRSFKQDLRWTQLKQLLVSPKGS